MKRFFVLVISVAAIGFLFSFGSSNSSSFSKWMVGQKVSIKDLLGEESESDWYLINLWAVYDAASRDENVRFSTVIQKLNANNHSIKSISVSMDKYESIFEEVIKQDGLNFSEIRREPDGFRSKFAKAMKLNSKFGSFLIDGNGKIVAKKIVPEELEASFSAE